MAEMTDMQNAYEALNRDADFYANDYRPSDLFTFGSTWRDRQTDRAQQKSADLFNMMEAAKQRDFEERMDNTKYQRAAKDLAAVGFSPLALLQNAPNSAPSGSAASYTAGAKARSKQKSGFSDLAGLVVRVLGLIALAG